MRILFAMPSVSAIGGVETWLRHLVAAMLEKGWDPIVGLAHGARSHDAMAFARAHPDLPSMVLDGRGMDVRSRIRLVEGAIAKVDPDWFIPLTIIDAHDAVCRRKARGGRTRYLFSLRGNLPRQISDARRYAPHVDLAVCPGRLGSRLCAWAGVPEERIVHVPHGAQVADASRGESGSRLRLGYVGRLGLKDKRSEDLVPVARSLLERGVDFHLRIVGSGPTRPSLEERLSDLMSSGTVTFSGSIPNRSVIEDVYPELDALLSLSSSEGFGISIIEAMAAGVVPVSSEFVGLKAEDLLRHDETALLFPVGNTDRAAEMIARLSASREDLARLSEAAGAAVVDLRWERSTLRWVEALIQASERPVRCGASPPRPMPPRHGLAASLPLPEAVLEAWYSLRRRLRGVPEAMLGGQEWSWHTGLATENELHEIASVVESLDVRPT